MAIKRNPYDISILSLCDGKNSILDISKKANLSYPTTFTRVKALEKKKDILITSPELIGDKSIIVINPEKEQEISKMVEEYRINNKLLNEHLKKTHLEKEIKNFLQYLQKNRFTSYSQYLAQSKTYAELSMIFPTLEGLGIVRERLEITKAGARLLKELQEKSKQHGQN